MEILVFFHADSTSVLNKLLLEHKYMYFSVLIQVTKLYFKFLSYKLVSYQKHLQSQKFLNNEQSVILTAKMQLSTF